MQYLEFSVTLCPTKGCVPQRHGAARGYQGLGGHQPHDVCQCLSCPPDDGADQGCAWPLQYTVSQSIQDIHLDIGTDVGTDREAGREGLVSSHDRSSNEPLNSTGKENRDTTYILQYLLNLKRHKEDALVVGIYLSSAIR